MVGPELHLIARAYMYHTVRETKIMYCVLRMDEDGGNPLTASTTAEGNSKKCDAEVRLMTSYQTSCDGYASSLAREIMEVKEFRYTVHVVLAVSLGRRVQAPSRV